MYIVVAIFIYQPIFKFLPYLVELNGAVKSVVSGLCAFFMAFLMVETFKVTATIVLILSFLVMIFVGISSDYTFSDLKKGIQVVTSSISSFIEEQTSDKEKTP